MPFPNAEESKNDFIQRAVRTFLGEGFTKKQAVGRAYGFWKSYKKKRKGAADQTGVKS